MFEIIASKQDRNSGFLINHMFKTAGSVMDNIAEGFERGGNKELIHFLSISKGSAGELRSQLYRAWDININDQKEFDILSKMVTSISVQISLFMKYLQKSNLKGIKFKEPIADYSLELELTHFFNPELMVPDIPTRSDRE